MHVKSLMGLKIWRSWGVDKPISNLQQVRVLLKNHAQLQNSNGRGGRCRFYGFFVKIERMPAMNLQQVRVLLKNHAQLHFLSR